MKVRRGEVWLAELGNAEGSEQAGTRPVIVLQNNAVNRFTTTLLTIPLTTNRRRASLPSCVAIAAGEGGLVQESIALCHQLRVLDQTRLKHRLGRLGPGTIEAIEACVLFTLGIDI